MRGLQCRAEARAELLALYGLPTAESRLAAASEMYRVFIFDAWMRHHVAITVERGPDSPPTLTLYAPPRPDPQGAGPQVVPPVSVPMTLDDWYAVRRIGNLFYRQLVPEPDEPGVIRICGGHGPLYFVESSEPAASGDGRVRRSGLTYCAEGLAEAFGIELALLAARLIPSCAALDETAFFFTAERLRACAILSGDRLAAAEVYNLMRPLLRHRERPNADHLESLFRNAEVRGSAAGEGVAPHQRWLQALAGEERAAFVVERVHAASAGHAVVEGVLRRRFRPQNEQESRQRRTEEAAVQLVWSSDLSSDFRLRSLTIGDYRPAGDRCTSSDRTRRAADC